MVFSIDIIVLLSPAVSVTKPIIKFNIPEDTKYCEFR